ncbi:MAG: energy-coupling factor ABC transporter ATP-binding protein [Mobilitalea sp.]
MNQFFFKCNKVSFSYERDKDILKNVSFYADTQESIGLIGANGVGKSTLLRILVGLELNFTGEVLVDQVPVNKKNLSQIRSNLGYLFQDSENQLFTPSVYQDVAFALQNNNLDQKLIDERVMRALETVNIGHLKDNKVYKLSGGEKKLASIATILAMNPKILLMDEPTIALDPKNRRTLINTLNKLDYLKIIASHDLDMVLETCSRVILLSEGQVVADDAAEKILTNKELLEKHGLELPLCMSGR